MKITFKDGTVVEVTNTEGKSKEEIIAEAKQVYDEFKDSQTKDSVSKEDILSYFSKEDLENYSNDALSFAYINGMKPSECKGMQVEPEFEEEMIDEYDDVYTAISQAKRSLNDSVKDSQTNDIDYLGIRPKKADEDIPYDQEKYLDKCFYEAIEQGMNTYESAKDYIFKKFSEKYPKVIKKIDKYPYMKNDENLKRLFNFQLKSYQLTQQAIEEKKKEKEYNKLSPEEQGNQFISENETKIKDYLYNWFITTFKKEPNTSMDDIYLGCDRIFNKDHEYPFAVGMGNFQRMRFFDKLRNAYKLNILPIFWIKDACKKAFDETKTLRNADKEALAKFSDSIDEVTFKLAKRKNQYDEYVVRCYINGKYNEEGSYYTDDWEDAVGTIADLARRNNLTINNEGNKVTAEKVIQDTCTNDECSQSVQDEGLTKIITLDQLEEGQSGKLLEDIPYDLYAELTEGYEDDVIDWVNKVFIKGIYDGEEYAIVPKGTIVKLINSHGPGGGWPVFEINGEEVDFAGDLDEFKVIVQDDNANQLYGYIILKDEFDENRLPEILDTYNLEGYEKIRGNYLLKGSAENLVNFAQKELGETGSLEDFIKAAGEGYTRVKLCDELKLAEFGKFYGLGSEFNTDAEYVVISDYSDKKLTEDNIYSVDSGETVGSLEEILENHFKFVTDKEEAKEALISFDPAWAENIDETIDVEDPKGIYAIYKSITPVTNYDDESFDENSYFFYDQIVDDFATDYDSYYENKKSSVESADGDEE